MRLEQQIRALRVTTDLPGAHDVEAMANRVERLELLYQAARRDDPQSGTHGFYTGLHQESPV